ncbi:hypothetical protein V500_06814 [Pseudogymnoascus sp. VKM F-4518 (FW-2643)]|nr:hypothetical protein V500_06814 [Pseudogymnoascus sp. VKM F-4518 (FW-2643)]
MSLNSVNPFESPDPDSPMPDNATESESPLRLSSDANLSTPPGPEILCIGHSALPLQSFIQFLRTMQVSLIVDVRARPVSDVNPQFNLLNLESNDDLKRAKMEYVWFGLSLGGRRENMEGLRRHREMLIPDLKNYAAYMTTPEFKEGLAEVKSLAIREAAKGKKIVIMCKEPVHSRCHRRMIADRLMADNWIVQHIGLRESDCVKHEMWNLARLALDGELVYDMPRLVN